MQTSPNSEQSTQRKRAARTSFLLIVVFSGAALTLAWTLWGTGDSPSEQLNRPGVILHPSPIPSTEVILETEVANSRSIALAASARAHGDIASPRLQPSRTAVVQQLPSAPEIDLATQAHLALQSGTPKEALEVASEMSLCEFSDRVVASEYESYQKQNQANQDPVQLNKALESQRRCQAVNAAAKDLEEPLVLRSFEGDCPRLLCSSR